MIRPCRRDEQKKVWEIINDGAAAYDGVIPADCFGQPYMSEAKLASEIAAGVVFFGHEEDSHLVGVMGIQRVKDVLLIRHAYVRTAWQGRGIGAALLTHLTAESNEPVLIGTWADAAWAIRFYRQRGFELVPSPHVPLLLSTYWNVPERQIQTSVVLANEHWRNRFAVLEA